MANINFAKIVIAGRITKDIELKTTKSGKSVVSFSVAVSRRTGGENVTDFFEVTAFDKNAETASKFFHKGSSILVDGVPAFREYTTQSGEKRKVLEIRANQICFVDSREESTPAPQNTYMPDAYKEPPKFDDLSEEEDLPF
jgi:single-strand DNA-binding protein